MTMFEGKVLVLGANGETGRRVVKNLHGKGIAVRAMVRAEDRIRNTPELTLNGIEVLIGSVLNMDDLLRAMRGIRAVISALGSRIQYTDEEVEAIEATAPMYIVAAALEERVEHLVMCSSFGTETPDFNPSVSRAHSQAEASRRAGCDQQRHSVYDRPSGRLDQRTCQRERPDRVQTDIFRHDQPRRCGRSAGAGAIAA